MTILLITVVAFALIELIASGTWNASYFRNGITLFSRSCTLAGPPDLSPRALQRAHHAAFGPRLRFVTLKANEIAFRETYSDYLLLSYPPMMRGLIRYDPDRRTLEVTGRANWTPVLLGGAVIVGSLARSDLNRISTWVFAIALPAVAFAGLLALQRRRYDAVFASIVPH